MNPSNIRNIAGLYLIACETDTFVPPSMTFSELDDEFPLLPPSYCAITDREAP
ncbi:hypothetical protein QE369_004414 [Agrobacterium larrymoorei]|uniref:Uncharacterized protein n=1 Tax=Agrobacterium larrymoorei TaxID=160699 RepID=A0AAJ2EX18_9HYPH|nr:hypothetical protein [Agrobacterium larrymoorei]